MQQPFHFFLLFSITTTIYSLFLNITCADIGPSANISSTWINNKSTESSNDFQNGVIIRNILLRYTYDTNYPDISCGFICPSVDSAGSCESFLFSVIIGYNGDPRIVWSANRDRPVQENATLEFSQNGDLVLRDFDGTTVWSTNTSAKSVIGMELNDVASLVLFDKKKNTVWSSQEYPTDSLVLGQTLREGQRLTANISPTNSSQGPLYFSLYFSVLSGGCLNAFAGSQVYYERCFPTDKPTGKPTYITFNNGSLGIHGATYNASLPFADSLQYMQFDYGGHLKVYEWRSIGWITVKDFLQRIPDDGGCWYPTVCGEYGICSNGQCSCPPSDDYIVNYFRPVDPRNIHLGCVPVNALSCNKSAKTQLLSLANVDYFYTNHVQNDKVVDYFYTNHVQNDTVVYMIDTNVEACKQACLANCSCKAAFFLYGSNPNASNGYCYWPLELYSLKNNVPGISNYKSSAFIKVQSYPQKNSTFSTVNTNVSNGKRVSPGIIVAASAGALLACSLVALSVIALVMRRCCYRDDADDDEFSMLPGLPIRFAFNDLRVATNNFLRKLGEGGFGSVFEGTLVDGTKIAVKRLDNIGQGKKEFLAEVETIGRIHHLHLVRLVGFCAEKTYRLLIYEYMLNGSLDKWIFYKNHDTVLDWQTRRKIITDIAKGLTYLHEECRHKIVHLDIKPQNILLDENFNAKVSDFGLAKLIDRDQIEVMTRMRGTPGYLAPEWLTSIITEKVDVFSFGVVILEMVCGRRNLDHSKDDESFHLIGLLQRKVTENKLVDMIDCRCADMKVHIKDVIMIIHLAMWCIQSDSNKRPLMSVVLKVLEGSVKVEADLDYNFSNATRHVPQNVNIMVSALPTPSILSGPR